MMTVERDGWCETRWENILAKLLRLEREREKDEHIHKTHPTHKPGCRAARGTATSIVRRSRVSDCQSEKSFVSVYERVRLIKESHGLCGHVGKVRLLILEMD